MNNIIVQKFGGTSIGSIEKIKTIANRIKKYKDNNNQLVIVVSAMGNTTNELLEKAKLISNHPSPRELDVLLSTGEQISISLLSIALQEIGCDSISLTGSQSGIKTDSYHKKARITSIKTNRIEEELKNGKIVIIAGFQGVTSNYDVTTLGRGGSDTTAVAISASLNAKLCEIYTDVNGIYTTDPRICDEAVKLNSISYDEMLEMARQGANVLHPRSVEIASKYKIPLVVRSSFNECEGTRIIEEKKMEKTLINGIALDNNICRITVTKVPDEPGIAFKLFSLLAKSNISVDTIIQNLNHDNKNDISFTISEENFEKANEICNTFSSQYEFTKILSKKNVSKLSVIGTGITSNAEIASDFFLTLYELGINIEMISTSEIKISCIIQSSDAEKAVKQIHKKFELDKINIL
ncbi:MAG: aspartate kinase [Bacillota bacterium]|nr:aspartate kinase [Bacillota bacterium]